MLKELRTFIAVARAGTFSAAGQRLGLTQSAVSAQIQRLEDQLGARLFDRTGRSATLNARGTEALGMAEQVVALFDRMVARQGTGASAGVVTIGAIASAQPLLLGRALASYTAAHPRVKIKVIPGVSLVLLDKVDAGEIGHAVIVRPPFALPADWTWTSLVREPYVLVAPPDAGASDWRALLAEAPFIRYDRASFGGRQLDRFLRAAGIAVRDLAELDQIEAIVELVRRKVGVALVPRTASVSLAGLHVCAIDAPGLWREVGIVRGPRAEPDEIGDRLVEHVVRAARACCPDGAAPG